MSASRAFNNSFTAVSFEIEHIVTYAGFRIGWLYLLSLLLKLQSIIAAHNQTRSIPYWTTSVFSSAVTNFAIELSWTELTSRWTVRVLLCFIRCHGNVCLASRWLAMDLRVCLLIRERVLPNRCLAMAILFTVLLQRREKMRGDILKIICIVGSFMF
jgi:hypothetical protein